MGGKVFKVKCYCVDLKRLVMQMERKKFSGWNSKASSTWINVVDLVGVDEGSGSSGGFILGSTRR